MSSMTYLTALPTQQDLPIPVHFRRRGVGGNGGGNNSNNATTMNNSNNSNSNNSTSSNSDVLLLDESVFSQPLSVAQLTNEHTALLCARADHQVLYSWLERLKHFTQEQQRKGANSALPAARSYIAGLQNLHGEVLSYWQIEQRVFFPLTHDLKASSQAHQKINAVVNNLQRMQQQIKFHFSELKFQKEINMEAIYREILTPLEAYLNLVSKDLLPLIEHNLISSELDELAKQYLKVHGEVHRQCANDHKCMPNVKHQQPFRNKRGMPFHQHQNNNSNPLSVTPLSSKL